MVTAEFLESLEPNGAHSSNIEQISDNVFKFTQYNFLPGTCSNFDGHYTFFVNIKTFEYLAYKSSDYGGLTYTSQSKNVDWMQFNEFDKKMAESLIADKLLHSYYYSDNNINHRGAYLIPQKEGYSKNILIVDYRGYVWSGLKVNQRDKKTLEALKKIDKDFNQTKVKSIKILKVLNKSNVFYKDEKTKNTIKIGWILDIEVEVKTNKGCEIIQIQRDVSFGKIYSTSIVKNDKLISHFLGLKKIKEVTEILTEIYKSL